MAEGVTLSTVASWRMLGAAMVWSKHRSASAAISPSVRWVSRSRANLVIPLSNQAARSKSDMALHPPS